MVDFISYCSWNVQMLRSQHISDDVSPTTWSTFNIWYVHLYSNYRSTSHWHSVNLFPEKFNTNVIPCNSSQMLSFECTIALSSSFSNMPKMCSMDWGPDFSRLQLIPSVAGTSTKCCGLLSYPTKRSVFSDPSGVLMFWPPLHMHYNNCSWLWAF